MNEMQINFFFRLQNLNGCVLVLYFSKMDNLVFCTCQECKSLNVESGGRKVSKVTKWRHNKKENDWYNYLDNHESIEEPLKTEL